MVLDYIYVDHVSQTNDLFDFLSVGFSLSQSDRRYFYPQGVQEEGFYNVLVVEVHDPFFTFSFVFQQGVYTQVLVYQYLNKSGHPLILSGVIWIVYYWFGDHME